MVRRRSPDRFVHETDPIGGGSGGSSGITIVEEPTGATNGINVDYVTSRPYIPNTSRLYLNGLLQAESLHYHEMSSTLVRFLDAPLTGDKVLIAYDEA